MNQLENNKERIILSGGGTGGSVTPLLAIGESLKEAFPDRFEFHWVGTDTGIERRMTDSYPFVYHAIAAGKLRRYFSAQNFIDIINIIAGFFQSLNILIKLKPSLVISAGGFVSVPLAWAAKLLDIKVLVHQQDIRPGLANKLMSPCASLITTVFEKSLLDYGEKARWIGNPIRSAFKNLSLNTTQSNQILVLGGGTGSESLNRFVKNNIEKILEFAKVVHITGKHDVKSQLKNDLPGYQSYDLLDTVHVAKAINDADLVVTRAGLGTLSELSYLGKATIIIPIPHSHQEDNARYFSAHDAAFVLDQEYLNDEVFVAGLKKLILNMDERIKLATNMKQAMKQGANEEIVKLIDGLLTRK